MAVPFATIILYAICLSIIMAIISYCMFIISDHAVPRVDDIPGGAAIDRAQFTIPSGFWVFVGQVAGHLALWASHAREGGSDTAVFVAIECLETYMVQLWQ